MFPDPEVIERARRYVGKCDPAVSGQHGHDRAFRVAAVLVHGFALGDGDAMTVMHEWNASCVPPWSEAELVHKIKTARAAAHQRSRGWLLGTKSTSHPALSSIEEERDT